MTTLLHRRRACRPPATSSRPSTPGPTGSRCTSRSCSVGLLDDLRRARRRPAVRATPTSRRPSRTRSSPGSDRRTPEAAIVARAGAVIGRSFDLDLLVGRHRPAEPPSSRRRSPSSPTTSSCCRRTRRVGTASATRLICDAIYDHIPAPDRRALHGRTADAARRARTSGPCLPGAPPRAGRPSRRGVRGRRRRGAADATALSSHSRGSRALRLRPPDGAADLRRRERARLLEAFGASAAATDDNEAAADAFEAARAAYLRPPATPSRPRPLVAPLVAVRHLLGDDLGVARSPGSGRRSAEIAAAPVAPSDRRPTRHRIGSAPVCWRPWPRPTCSIDDLDEASAYAVEARRLAARVGDDATMIDAATTLGVCRGLRRSDVDEGWRLLEASIAEIAAAQLEAEAARGLPDARIVRVRPRRVRAGRALAAGRDRVRRAGRALEPPALHGGPPGPRPVGDRALGRGRRRRAAGLADGRGGITTRITALHVLGYRRARSRRAARRARSLDEARDDRRADGRAPAPVARALGPGRGRAGERRPRDARSGWHEEALAASRAVRDAAYLVPVRGHRHAGLPRRRRPVGARRWLDATASAGRGARDPGHAAGDRPCPRPPRAGRGLDREARDAARRAVAGWPDRERVVGGDLGDGRPGPLPISASNRGPTPPAWRPAPPRPRPGSVPRPCPRRRPRSCRHRRGRAALRSVGAADGSRVRGGPTRRRRPDQPGRSRPSSASRRKTVAAHVEHILAKLGVGRRAEIAAWTASGPVLHSRPHGGDREE